MIHMSQYEREEQQLDDDFASGRISASEHAKQLRQMQRDMRADIEEEAERAGDAVRDYYGY